MSGEDKRPRENPDHSIAPKKTKKSSDWGADAAPSRPASGFDNPGRDSRFADQQSATGTANRANRWDDGGTTPTPTPGGQRLDVQGKGWATPNQGGGRRGQGDTPTDRGTGTNMYPAGSPTPGQQTRREGASTPTPFVSMFPAESHQFYGGGEQNPYGMHADETDAQTLKLQIEMWERNGPIDDEVVAGMIPPGYALVEVPGNYRAPVPVFAPRPAHMPSAPTVDPSGSGLLGPKEQRVDLGNLGPDMPELREGDHQTFAILSNFKDIADDKLTGSPEYREALMLRCLLRVKNGVPSVRKSALRQITQKAKWFGATTILTAVIDILMNNTSLDEQDRHVMVKVLNRIIYVLGDTTRPMIHRILVVAEQMLIPRRPDAQTRGEDFYEKAEAREVIANLAKAVGLGSMINAMRPDVEHKEEEVRNSTAMAFAVVAQAVGVSAMIPFLRAACQNVKSWTSRHTGAKIVAQIAGLLGCGVLPHLRQLAEIITPGLDDEHNRLRVASALAVAALAEAATPYGIENFDGVLKRLYPGIMNQKGKALGAFLKAMGCLVPLMVPENANTCTRYMMNVVVREFSNVDEEMKKVVLRVVRQCVSTKGVQREHIVQDILPHFMRNFWVRKLAVASRNYRPLVDTTVVIAQQVGSAEVLVRIVKDLFDETEGFRRMVLETIDAIDKEVGTDDMDGTLESEMINGLLHVMREQTEDSDNVIKGMGTVINSLKVRCTIYIPRILATIRDRLKGSRNARLRQQAAELLVVIAPTLKVCDLTGSTLLEMSKVLYEMLLGEDDPNALGGIVMALDAVLMAIGMERISAGYIIDIVGQIKDIMSNRHEKVQEACVILVGNIADKNPDPVSKADWNRLSFALLDILKAPKKAVRKAATKTFGCIARAADPVHVVNTLLDNLKAQDRTQRVCTTVALAVVAEMCQPYVVVPWLMNEYRTPDSNVQNGVLKSLSFMFEYIGELGRAYAFKLVPLLEDALMERDMVHRQIACNVAKHMILAIRATGCDDAIVHLFNMVWPNIFETAPHCINAVLEVIEAVRVSLGPTILLQHVLQGLFHPSRRVREVYWRVYNVTYMGSQDALVPAMPRLQDDEHNCYRRWELEVFI